MSVKFGVYLQYVHIQSISNGVSVSAVYLDIGSIAHLIRWVGVVMM